LLELEQLAGQPESTDVRAEYERLLSLRVDNFSIDAPWFDEWHLSNFIHARHFLYLVPEIAEELRQAKLAAVQAAFERIDTVTPYWFVAGYDATHGEGTHQQLYDPTTFDALAWILQAPYAELIRYLDAPAFPVGDLMFINHLVTAIEAPGALATCGDGVVDAGETCDPPSTCPTSCDDGDDCTTDTLTGGPEICNVTCIHGDVACQSGDGCCPAGCTVDVDADCVGGGSAESSDGGGCGCAVRRDAAPGLVGLLGGALLLVRRRKSMRARRNERDSRASAARASRGNTYPEQE
jgi:MYXO-CTERM domain-containing protein